MSSRMRIVVSEIITDLSQGFTRTKNSVGYTSPNSIGEKYGLRNSQVTLLFNHPKLKGLRTKFPKDPGFDIVDDTVQAVAPPTLSPVRDGEPEAELNTNTPWDEGLGQDMDNVQDSVSEEQPY